MDTKKVILYGILAWIIYTLWNQWQQDYLISKPQALSVSVKKPLSYTVSSDFEKDSIEAVSHSKKDVDLKVSSAIKINTDVLQLTLNLPQGNITETKLLAYPQSIEDKSQPIILLRSTPNQQYKAFSDLVTIKNNLLDESSIDFTADNKVYTLANQKELTVRLEGKNNQGIKVIKEYVFARGSYLVNINYYLDNLSNQNWQGLINAQLLRTSPPEDSSSIFHIGSYIGASYSEPGQHRYQKVPFKTMEKSDLSVKTKGGWIAMQQHYFLTAWIPPVNQQNHFYTRYNNEDYLIGLVSPTIKLLPQAKQTFNLRLYVGPESTEVLKNIAPGLDLTVDYGWLWFLSSLLFSLMQTIYSIVGNWGWTIVLVTVLIKLAFYRLSATSYRSMANMRKLQPKLQALKERYGDDKAKISQATMELYRQEKVNPLGGCLPILIQIPVFIALYWVLIESVELRQAPFIFWIHDLAAADPYHILPVIMGLTMLVQQRLNPAPPDPMQAKVMMLLPILFTGLFWSFPAGLVLYWIVNNTLSIMQQWYITRKYSDDSRLAIIKK